MIPLTAVPTATPDEPLYQVMERRRWDGGTTWASAAHQSPGPSSERVTSTVPLFLTRGCVTAAPRADDVIGGRAFRFSGTLMRMPTHC